MYVTIRRFHGRIQFQDEISVWMMYLVVILVAPPPPPLERNSGTAEGGHRGKS